MAKIDEKGNPEGFQGVTPPMHSLLKSLKEADSVDQERRPIRLDGPCQQAGIAAALRRAFDNPSRPVTDDLEDDFALLLKQVH